jgi:hypothetical protein
MKYLDFRMSPAFDAPRARNGDGVMPGATAVSLNNQLVVLIELCRDCADACGACGRAFAASGLTDTFRDCESVCSDCADVCRATAQVAARYSGGDTTAFVALLRACAKACDECAVECAKRDLEAAAQCASASLACKHACERLAEVLRWR